MFARMVTQGRAGSLCHGQKGTAKISLGGSREGGDRCRCTAAPCHQHFRAELALNQGSIWLSSPSGGTDGDHLIDGLKCGNGVGPSIAGLDLRPQARAPSDFLYLKPAPGGSFRTIV